MSKSEKIREQLNSLYSKLDKEINSLSARCYGCGKCCNFKKNGLKLYVQKVELDLIKEETGITPYLLPEGNCVFQENDICTIHRIRPLGCRTFFSEAPNSTDHQNLFEVYHKKIKEIGNESDIEYIFEPFFTEND